MECPKCGNRQNGLVECEKCGIIFERYQMRQERIAAEETNQTDPAQGSEKTKSGRLGIIALVLALGAVGYFYSGPDAPSPAPPQTTITTQTPSTPTVSSPAAHQENTTRRTGQQAINTLEGITGQLAQTHPPGNELEWARNATVSISTPWGSGSGFFITGNGYIITNKHVVEFDASKLKELQRKADNLKKQLDNAQYNINYLQKQLARVRDANIKAQISEEIERRRQEYDKYNELHDQVREHLQKLARATGPSDITVTLIDGTQFQVESVRMSNNIDAALLSISCYNAPFLKPLGPGRLDQGQKVFTIGNPVGLSHTMTSGIVSGFRKYNGRMIIQTDAPINPGNSGGPLVDGHGKVLGVNTMVLRDTEGIGFAIPIKDIQEEFGLTLPNG